MSRVVIILLIVLLVLIGISISSYHHQTGSLLVAPCALLAAQPAGVAKTAIDDALPARPLDHPWRFTFESQFAMNLKRQTAIEELRKHLENPTTDVNGTVVLNRDDNCLQIPWHKKSDCMYRHIHEFVHLGFLQLENSMKLGKETKAMVDPRLFGDSCTAFCAGIAGDSTFEQALSVSCPTVHAFDCTVNPNKTHVKGKAFTFHQVCIGENVETSEAYKKRHGTNKNVMVTKSIQTIVSELNLTAIDILKFDIEGYEWNILEHILTLEPALRPMQLLFEVHTTGAHHRVVMPSVVAGKRQRQVDEVFVRLLEAGYAILDVQKSGLDNRCAEFSLLKII